MPGLVKIGVTDRLVEDRKRELFSTGVPVPFDIEFGLTTSHPKDVEDGAHRLLASARLPRREFFEVSVEEAIAAVQMAATEAAGIGRWSSTDVHHTILAGDRVALTTMSGQLFMHVYYPDAQAVLRNRPEIADIWQAHTDGDSLELMATHDSTHVISLGDDDPDNSWTDPVPYLDRAGTFPNATINGKERMLPGERLLWLGPSRDGSTCQLAVFDFDDDCQVISRTRQVKVASHDGVRYPLLLNFLTYEQLPPSVIRVGHSAIESLPSPQCWTPRYGEGADIHGGSPPPPEYWLSALKKPKRGRRRSI